MNKLVKFVSTKFILANKTTIISILYAQFVRYVHKLVLPMHDGFVYIIYPNRN